MPKLKKSLSFPTILLITINSIMGTGIFFLPAVGAGVSGPASILAWLLLSVLAIYISMCFAELSSMYPKAGGIYEFCKQAYGRFFSFLIGWMTILAGNITIAMLVVGAIQYLSPLGSPLFKIFVSLLFISIFNFIAFRGMKTSAVMLVTFAMITIGTLVALIIPGTLSFNSNYFQPFFVSQKSLLLLTIFLIAETFFGWETATFLAEETKDGQKVMPKALIYGTIIIAIISLSFVVTSLGSLPWQIFGQSSTPLADLGLLHYGTWGGPIFTILVYLAIIGSVAGWVVSAPRLLLAMAQDKLFLTQFARVHHKYFTPHRAILFQAVLTGILVIIGAGSYTTLLHLLVPIVLVAYTFVLMSVTILRYKKPTQTRYYRVPFAKIGPPLVCVFMLLLIVLWTVHTPGAIGIIRIIISLMVLGIPLYFLVEMYYDAPVILRVNEWLSHLSVVFDHFFFSTGIRRKLLATIAPLTQKKVLEFGCGVGSVTRTIARAVGPDGHVYAIDPIAHHLKVAAQHTRQPHVHFYHHKPLHHFHPSEKFPKVDALVSIGLLSYLQRPQAVLKHLATNVKSGGRIYFVDYDRFFHFLPNTPWLTTKNLERYFATAGFQVEVTTKQSLLWRYIIVTGKKR